MSKAIKIFLAALLVVGLCGFPAAGASVRAQGAAAPGDTLVIDGSPIIYPLVNASVTRFTATPAGSGVNMSVTQVAWIMSPDGQSLVTTFGFVPVTPAAPAWDVNEDHVANILDLVIIGVAWGSMGAPGWIREDVNSDGVVNVLDVVTVGSHWMQTW